MTKKVNVAVPGDEPHESKCTAVPWPLFWLTAICAMAFGYQRLETAEQEALALTIMRIAEEGREVLAHLRILHSRA